MSESSEQQLQKTENLSLMDLYLQETEENGGQFIKPPGGETREKELRKYRDADLRRWMWLRSAVIEKRPKKYIDSLLAADTIEKLGKIAVADRTGKSANEMIRSSKRHHEIWENSAKLQRELVAFGEQRGKSHALLRRQLDDNNGLHQFGFGEGVRIPDGPMTKEQVAELAKKANVFIKRTDDEVNEACDEYKLRRDNARAAQKFAKLGMPVEEFKDGIDESTDEATKKKFTDTVLAAASAMNRFEEFDDIRTRDDGEWSLNVGVDVKAMGQRIVEESGGMYDNIATSSLIDSVRLQLRMKATQDETSVAMAAMLLVDVPVLTPRMFNLVTGSPCGRVVSFSQVYRAYLAQMHVLANSDAAPTKKEIEKRERKIRKKMKTAGLKRINKKQPLTSMIDGQKCLSSYEEFRIEVHTMSVTLVDNMMQWYEGLDKKASDIEWWKGVHGTEPPEVDTGARYRWEKIFYARLYQEVRDNAVKLLRALEGGIVLFLGRYMSRGEYHRLCTEFREPPDSIMHPDFPAQLVEYNAALATMRNDLAELTQLADTTAYKIPALPDDCLDELIEPEKPYSPTYRQMRQVFDLFSRSCAPENTKTIKQALADYRKQRAENLKKQAKQHRESATPIETAPKMKPKITSDDNDVNDNDQ